MQPQSLEVGGAPSRAALLPGPGGCLSPAAAQTEFSFLQLRLSTLHLPVSALHAGLIWGFLFRQSLIFPSCCWLLSMGGIERLLQNRLGKKQVLFLSAWILRGRFVCLFLSRFHKQSLALFSFPSAFYSFISLSSTLPFSCQALDKAFWIQRWFHWNLCLQKDLSLMKENRTWPHNYNTMCWVLQLHYLSILSICWMKKEKNEY